MNSQLKSALTAFIYFFFLSAFFPSAFAGGDMNNKQAAYSAVASYVKKPTPVNMVLAPEGEFVAVFNEHVVDWIKAPLNADHATAMLAQLAQPLYIGLNENSYAPAATRTDGGEKDDTNYDAIWMRDNVWVYYALKANPARAEDANRLLLALWDYYSTDAQIARFKNIITTPSLASDAMNMPHIRFNGNSASLDDVYLDGKPQVWSHNQIDAHGLFFSALGEALQAGRLTTDAMTPARMQSLLMYPQFLKAIAFYNFEDAGAWEEISRKNTSSIGLATRSLQVWREVVYGKNKPLAKRMRKEIKATAQTYQKAWSKKVLKSLIAQGLATVKSQLSMGGESPDYAASDIHFRRADAALLHLITPTPLQGLTDQERRNIMALVETLKRPFGVLRYTNDSYQSGNYWIREPAKGGPSLTGDTSSNKAFMWRLSQLEPNTEAQWFFDSLIALAWMDIAKHAPSQAQKEKDIHLAKIHIKRALGQLTGANQIAADGKPVKAWMATESINTVIIDGQRHYLASPITPLNWAKAGLYMSLNGLQSF